MYKLLFPLMFAGAAFANEGAITLSDAYIRASTPMAKSGAAFMVIDNGTDKDVRLLGAETKLAKKASVHTSLQSDSGVMKMTEVKGGLLIPADSCAILERGGIHLMLMGVNQEFKQGDLIDVTLKFENADDVKTQIKVDLERGEDGERALPEGRESCIDAAAIANDVKANMGDDEGMKMDDMKEKMDDKNMEHNDMEKSEDHEAMGHS